MQTREVIRTIEALHRYMEKLCRQTARGAGQSDERLSPVFTAMQQALVTLRAAATQRPRRRVGVARRKRGDEFAHPTDNPAAELRHTKAALQEEIRRRKEAEAALQESRNLLSTFADSIPDSFFVKNAQGRYEVINARGACFFGTSIEEVIGKADTELLPAPVALRIREEDLAVTTTGQVQTYEDTFLMEEGSRTYLSTKNVYRDRRGRVRGVIGLTRDITERKQEEETLLARAQHYQKLALEREQQLILSDRLVSLGELAASLAHELNNPLGIIQGFAQDLAREITPAAPHYQPLKIIQEEAHRCAQLVSDLLEFARPARADLRRTDIVEVVRRSLRLASVRFRKGKIKTVCECQPHLPRIQADPQQLQQVLLNIFFNAVEAMPGGGNLAVQVATDPVQDRPIKRKPGLTKRVRITVADTGTGIHKHDLPKICRPFFTTKTKGGMGLGLSICESIIHAHGGQIEVESTPGQGTRVSVVLLVKGDPSAHPV